jgi:hypothetical protein
MTKFVLCYTDDNPIGLFEASIEATKELQDAQSYYKAIKPTVERENAIGLGTYDPRVMRSCRRIIFLMLVMVM